MLVEVLKSRTIDGVVRARGDVLDATDWPKLHSMIRAGIVRYYAALASMDRAARKGVRHGVGAND